MKNILLFLVLICFVLLGLNYYQYQTQKVPEVEVQASVLLEKVRNVAKLVTVEGDFLEIYHEINNSPITVYLPFPTTFTFSKEASIELSGKVLVGYNMEKVNIKMDSDTKTVIISNLPEPEVIAIDHNLKYINLEESYFNSFTKDDYTQLNKNAKEEIRKRTLNGELIDKAKLEGNYMIKIMRTVVESSGWQFIISDAPIEKPALRD